MARSRSWWNIGKLVLLALPLAAARVPADTDLQLRLASKVASNTCRPGDRVEAIVIAPVMSGGDILLPAGVRVRGSVMQAQPSSGPSDRAVLAITFSELEVAGRKLKLSGLVTEIDNARETVDAQGRVLGIVASETISARLDAGIGRLAEKYSGLAGVLGTAKGAVLKQAEGEIVYEPGVELTFRLTRPLEVPAQAAEAGPKLEPFADEAALARMAREQPFQTMSQKPSKPSDITNLMFIGSEEALRRAFQEAGWTTAAALDAQSSLETFRAIAELRGYKEAPVSVLLLEGRPPDLVFQKQNNTFAMRHHLRIWRRPGAYGGEPVWVCAATHDIGIEFSQENRTFIHKIDPHIDTERAKVVTDLLLTGMVRSLALVDRPHVPKASRNATGDELLTDGSIAVLLLHPAASASG